jgi:hypothetical protein
MTATSDLTKLARSTYRDTQQDGLTEIVMGVFLFIIALATGRPAFYWTYLIGLFALGRGLKQLKARYTYPRVGFAEVPGEDAGELGRGVLTWVLGVFAVMLAGLAISGDLTNSAAWRQWSAALAGALCMGGFLYAASRSGLLRQYAYALVSVVLGVVVSWRAPAGDYQGVRVWALVMGLLLLGGGGLIFRRFLRDNPVVAQRGPEPEGNSDDAVAGDAGAARG